MKVGTDGVLIGAWANCEQRKRMLDVGAGTGVISLMIAQRNPDVIIDAVEIDKDAAEQMTDNFEISQWSNRLNVANATFQNFAHSSTVTYDLIISNPPYFLNSLKNMELKKTVARHAELLPYEDLIEGVIKLLSEDGLFSAIFPYEEANLFVAMAALKGLYCVRRLDVRGRSRKPVKRVLLEFSKNKVEPNFDEMIIEEGERHSYTEKYKNLTKDFYLKF
ncbi:MAG: methyltransferase [Rikenellaceae bacterium]